MMKNFENLLYKAIFLLFILNTLPVSAEVDDEYSMPPFEEYEGCCYSNNSFPLTIDLGLAFENFRSVPDGSWDGNYGSFASINFGMPLYELSCYGLGMQLGGSYGLYDWAGRGSALEGSQRALQQQGFLTFAIFRRTPCEFGFNAALAYDAMFNTHFGVWGLDTSIYQIRFSASYQFCESNEYGIWGTIHTNTSHKSTLGFPVSFRAIDQINLFWSHFFECNAESSVWIGIPYGKSLMASSSRQGAFLVGASFRVPLIDRWDIDGRALYMSPTHASNFEQRKNYAANVCIGINYAFGGSECCYNQPANYRPYLPIANNSNFLADSSLNY